MTSFSPIRSIIIFRAVRYENVVQITLTLLSDIGYFHHFLSTNHLSVALLNISLAQECLSHVGL